MPLPHAPTAPHAPPCAAAALASRRHHGGGALRRCAPPAARRQPGKAAAVVASERSFAASRALSLPLRTEHAAFPVEHYLQNAERVVHLSFPDSKRRQRLAPDTWRVQLLPMQFLWLTLRVSCTLRAWPDAPGALAICGREMAVDGLPPELAGLASSIMLRVDGALRTARPATSPSATSASAAAPALLQGRVALRIGADVPPLIGLTPGLDAVVTGILDAILGRLETALRAGLLEDYAAWVREQEAREGVAAR